MSTDKQKGNLYKFMRISRGLTRKDACKLLNLSNTSRIQHLEERNKASYNTDLVYKAYNYPTDFKAEQRHVEYEIDKANKELERLDELNKEDGFALEVPRYHLIKTNLRFLIPYLESL